MKNDCFLYKVFRWGQEELSRSYEKSTQRNKRVSQRAFRSAYCNGRNKFMYYKAIQTKVDSLYLKI